MKNVVFWDVMQYGSCKNWRFEGKYRLYHQSDKNWSEFLAAGPEVPGFNSQRCQFFWVTVSLEHGPLSSCEDKWGATWKKSSGSGLENWD
jgi:hypothetical protein